MMTVLNLIGKIYSLKFFLTINREHIELDKLEDAKKYAEKSKKSLLCFQDTGIKNSFFDAILYGLLFKSSEDNKVSKKI